MSNNHFGPLFFPLYKPAGITSFDVIRQFKRLPQCHLKKLGHMGTLDPFADGVLLLGAFGATKLFDFFQQYVDKEYIAKCQFGQWSSTGDWTGELSTKITSFSQDTFSLSSHPSRQEFLNNQSFQESMNRQGKEKHFHELWVQLCSGNLRTLEHMSFREWIEKELYVWIVKSSQAKYAQKNSSTNERQDISEAKVSFTQSYWQAPPAYSAVKIAGVRSYKMARHQQFVQHQAVKRQFYDLKILGWNNLDKTLDLKLRVGGGTYIRTLCEDIGTLLGFSCYLKGLTRSAIGHLTMTHCYSLDDLQNTQSQQWFSLGLSPETIFPFPYFYPANDQQEKLMRNGSSLFVHKNSQELEYMEEFTTNDSSILKLQSEKPPYYWGKRHPSYPYVNGLYKRMQLKSIQSFNEKFDEVWKPVVLFHGL